MFIGHFAVGFALKRTAPRTSLGWLIAAPQLLDMLWPIFLLLGWEQVRIDPGNTPMTPLAFDRYPWSHSLIMAVIWGVLLAALYYGRTHLRTAAVWLTAAVVSHWVLDWATHRPDMPLAPWSDVKVGLGLWYSVAATVVVEGAMLAVGVWMYVRSTTARDRSGTIGFWAFVAFLVIAYVGNIVGPPPPDVRSVAFLALGIWLLPLWCAWFDQHRRVERA
jgi:membrane-bound metal-dependent hydrolase YbcI (DUF457 family)